MKSEPYLLQENEYPPLLKEIPDKPKKLYALGNLPNWSAYKFLTVVGSRKYSSYGKECCQKLISGLRGYPLIIVSGLAIGIDSIAHKSALEAGLKTIAVPGSGLLPSVIYPRSNLNLARKIISQGGALLSEFEPDFRATSWGFPQRNRIMAGMSNAVFIVEAEKKSGTLITSRLATEYNRDVLTLPASIFSKNSEGPHMLIRLGATPITSSEDILEALGIEEKAGQTKVRNYDDCSMAEKKVIDLLASPLQREILVEKLSMPISQANTILSILELKGYIKENMGEIHLI